MMTGNYADSLPFAKEMKRLEQLRIDALTSIAKSLEDIKLELSKQTELLVKVFAEKS